jgi:hypothetical protein
MRRPDPAADACRRAWAACPNCADQVSCGACSSGETCEEHWRYLLATEPHRAFLQCRRCLHRWWHRTHERASQRPAAAEALPNWPGAA